MVGVHGDYAGRVLVISVFEQSLVNDSLANTAYIY